MAQRKPSDKAAERRKYFRIARQGKADLYSMQFLVDGRTWRTSVRDLDLKRAQTQLARLRDHGCPVREEIATI